MRDRLQTTQRSWSSVQLRNGKVDWASFGWYSIAGAGQQRRLRHASGVQAPLPAELDGLDLQISANYSHLKAPLLHACTCTAVMRSTVVQMSSIVATNSPCLSSGVKQGAWQCWWSRWCVCSSNSSTTFCIELWLPFVATTCEPCILVYKQPIALPRGSTRTKLWGIECSRQLGRR